MQLTSIGYSATGEVFHVDTVALAAETASQLGAAKLIFVTEGQTFTTQHGESKYVPWALTACLTYSRCVLPVLNVCAHSALSEDKALHSLRLSEARAAFKTLMGHSKDQEHEGGEVSTLIAPYPSSDHQGRRNYTLHTADMVKQSIRALTHGVLRAHLVPPNNGALLQELFTRDGAGLLISRDIYDGIRKACADDVPGIQVRTLLCSAPLRQLPPSNHVSWLVQEIIRPLETAGILVPRPREMLERDLSHFYVFVRDNAVLACAYLKSFGETHAEIGCLAVHPAYRHGGRGEVRQWGAMNSPPRSLM